MCDYTFAKNVLPESGQNEVRKAHNNANALQCYLPHSVPVLMVTLVKCDDKFNKSTALKQASLGGNASPFENSNHTEGAPMFAQCFHRLICFG